MTAATVSYLDLDAVDIYPLTMAAEDHRRRSVERLFPDHQWDDELGPLANWRNAVAEANGLTVAEAKEAISNAAFLNPTLARWIWYLA